MRVTPELNVEWRWVIPDHLIQVQRRICLGEPYEDRCHGVQRVESIREVDMVDDLIRFGLDIAASCPLLCRKQFLLDTKR